MQTRIDATRDQIIAAARRLVARFGYAATSMPAVAAAAGISTGAVYRHFSSKAVLFDEVFQQASQHEIAACDRAARESGSARARLTRMVETFARRALDGRQLAWALLVEPVSPQVDVDRRRFREPYRAIFERIIRDGIEDGQIVRQDIHVAATSLMGAIVETLLGPLSEPPHPAQEDDLIKGLVQFCVHALGPVPSIPASTKAVP